MFYVREIKYLKQKLKLISPNTSTSSKQLQPKMWVKSCKYANK